MENNDIKKTDVKQIIFLILISILILVLVFVLVTLIKNKEIISSDPLIYGMEVHNFNSCSCLDNDGKVWQSTENGFVYKEVTGKVDYTNFSNLPELANIK